MKLNEDRSKALFYELGLPVPPGLLLRPEDLGSVRISPPFPSPWMLKSLVLAGGRGKAGGIRKVSDLEQLHEVAGALFSLTIKGESVRLLRLEPMIPVQREIYLSFDLHRTRKRLLFTVGKEGGTAIEEMGPENLLVQAIRPGQDPSDYQVRTAFFHLGLDKPLWPGFRQIVLSLGRAVTDYGLLLAEINPLVVTVDGTWLALDGKVEIDDNMAAILPELARFREPLHATVEENRARDAGLSFHTLNGWVGLMANGAGLAMATMDVLNLSGMPAANFLDLGGGADQPRIATAFDILFQDSSVKAVLVNIFGGILSCAKVAEAMAEVLSRRTVSKPVVLRFDGNGAEEGSALLRERHIDNVHPARGLDHALELLSAFAPEPIERPSGKAAIQAGPNLSSSSVMSAPLGLSKELPVLVQGLTGAEGKRHARLMLEYGTNIVAGVTPFKGGAEVLGLPVYDSVRQAVKVHEIGATILFVPAAAAADAILEAADAGIPWIVCITEGIPLVQMLALHDRLHGSGSRLIGPNTPGMIVPGQTKLGIMPGELFTPGPVAVLSRSGTLTYESVSRLTRAGIGQSVCVGIGGDPFVGTSFAELCEQVRCDEATRALLVLGEIGGRAEEELADYVRTSGFEKPVFVFIAGRTAPPGKTLGHAGAILEEGGGGIEAKIERLQDAGITLCPDLGSIPLLLSQALSS
jgi:succinyl-CoA synthetase alpha subunit